MPRRNRNVPADRRPGLLDELTAQTVRRLNRQARRKGRAA